MRPTPLAGAYEVPPATAIRAASVGFPLPSRGIVGGSGIRPPVVRSQPVTRTRVVTPMIATPRSSPPY